MSRAITIRETTTGEQTAKESGRNGLTFLTFCHGMSSRSRRLDIAAVILSLLREEEFSQNRQRLHAVREALRSLGRREAQVADVLKRFDLL
jgi:predicted nucleic-acid-binding protein